MSHSTKNGEIDKLSNKYSSIIRIFDMENDGDTNLNIWNIYKEGI